METQAAEAPSTPAPARDEHGHWIRGASGNPAGRVPKGEGLQHWLDLVARRPHVPGGASYAERSAVMLWSKAAAGEIEAIRYVFDRVLGKPMQSVALTTDVPPLVFALVPPGTQAPTLIEAQSTEAPTQLEAEAQSPQRVQTQVEAPPHG